MPEGRGDPLCSKAPTRGERRETMNVKKLAIPAMCLGLLGVVGGVAAANAFQPAAPQPKVQFVQPAAQVATPEPVATTTAPKPVAPKPVKKAPAKVAPAPVESTQAVAPAPAPVQQKAATVAEPTSTPSQTQATPDATYTPPAGSAADSMLRKMKNPPTPEP